MNRPFAQTMLAGAAIGGRLLLKFSADNTVVQATGPTDSIIGVSDSLGADVAGAPVTVYRGGVPEVLAGGVIARGGFITSDANGKAVAPAPAGGANNRIAGTADATSAAGDIIPMLFQVGSLQG